MVLETSIPRESRLSANLNGAFSKINCIEKKSVFYICGPTVSGKTSFSVSLARACPNIVFINADTMQMYKGLEPLAGHPTEQDLRAMNCKLFSVLELHEEMSVSKWLTLASYEIEKAFEEGKQPFLIGGSRSFSAALAQSSYGIDLDVNQESEVTFPKEKTLPLFEYNLYSIVLLPEITNIDQRVWKFIHCNEREALKATKYVLDQNIPDNAPGLWVIGFKEYSDFLNGKCNLQKAQEIIFNRGINYAQEQRKLFLSFTDQKWNNFTLTIKSSNTLRRLGETLLYISDYMGNETSHQFP